ncbi:MAG: ADP-forming succinate--CoA ligase subunit beta [candidate division WOR-3 bacterium]
MKLYEFQAKEIFRASNIPCPKEKLVSSVEEGKSSVSEIGFPSVLKAQVLVGGRGKAGGIKILEKEEDFLPTLESIFSLRIKDLPVEKVLISEKVEIERELYLSIILDRRLAQPIILASPFGGMDIEEIAKEKPKSIIKESINPLLGLLPYQCRRIGFQLFPKEEKLLDKFASLLMSLTKVFFRYDAQLVEINPLVINKNGEFFALDAKMILDDNASFRHPEWAEYKTFEEETEAEAKKEGLSYVRLSGEIGSIVNGAGLAMATLDLINRYGAQAANFLDIGGSSSPEKTKKALEIITRDKNVRVILLNIFGGITRCDDVAKGILAFLKEREINLPIVARLVGTNYEEAKTLLKEIPIIFTDTMKEAVKKASELVKGS